MPKRKDTYYPETCTWVNFGDPILNNIILKFTIHLQRVVTKIVHERTN